MTPPAQGIRDVASPDVRANKQKRRCFARDAAAVRRGAARRGALATPAPPHLGREEEPNVLQHGRLERVGLAPPQRDLPVERPPYGVMMVVVGW